MPAKKAKSKKSKQKKSKSSGLGTLKEYTFGLYPLKLGDRVMTSSEAASVTKVLDAMHASPPDDDGYRHVPLGNGTHFGLRGFLENVPVRGIPVEFLLEKEFSTAEASLVLQLATAGNLFISSTIDPDRVATPGLVKDPRFHQRHKHSSVVADAEALRKWVTKHIGARDVLDVRGKTWEDLVEALSDG